MPIFEQPLEDRYNELLVERITLEGNVAMLKQQYKNDIAREKSLRYRQLLWLLLLPFLSLICIHRTPPSVYQEKIAIQHDSIEKLKTERENMQKTVKQRVKYVLKEGDMLVSLGYLFYNDSTAGYQIGQDNGLVTPYAQRHLKIGDTIIIQFR